MSKREELIAMMERSRNAMLPLLEEIDLNRKIYPLWTIREMLAHISGWDDAVIAFMQSLMAGKVPAIPAARGADVYNAETVSTREGLDYDHIYREYIATRKVVLDLLRTIPEEKIAEQHALPWGDPGTLIDIINIFGPHEEEHAEDLKKLIEEHKNK